jgi:hypothetical protein
MELAAKFKAFTCMQRELDEDLCDPNPPKDRQSKFLDRMKKFDEEPEGPIKTPSALKLVFAFTVKSKIN